MIRFIVGVPGSGKTYYSVYNIHKSITDKNRSEKHFYIYTNINQFNYKLSEKLRPYDHEKTYKCIELLHKYFKKKKNDAFLISMAKKLKLYKSYFVIDEAHLYFDVRKPALIWWLSYHRHLYQDIDLITQNLSLIDSKYKAFAEYFIRATPRSLGILSKTFTYKLFIDSRMSMKSRAGIEKLPQKKEVFDLYVSGGKVNSKNLIYKYIYFSVIGLIVLLLFFYYIISEMRSRAESEKSYTVTSQRHVEQSSLSTRSNIIGSESIYTAITCINDYCYVNNNPVPLVSFTQIVKETNVRILHIDRSHMQKKAIIYLVANNAFINLFKGVNNEKDSVIANLFSTSGRSE